MDLLIFRCVASLISQPIPHLLTHCYVVKKNEILFVADILYRNSCYLNINFPRRWIDRCIKILRRPGKSYRHHENPAKVEVWRICYNGGFQGKNMLLLKISRLEYATIEDINVRAC